MNENIWTAVVLSFRGGEYYGTCVARTEPEVWELVRAQFDPEGEYDGPPLSWAQFEAFYQFEIHVNPHEVA